MRIIESGAGASAPGFAGGFAGPTPSSMQFNEPAHKTPGRAGGYRPFATWPASRNTRAASDALAGGAGPAAVSAAVFPSLGTYAVIESLDAVSKPAI